MNLFNKNYPYHLPLLIAGAVLLLFPALGAVHLFDWDEINFAESAREMLTSGDYRHVQINYEPFIEKPPLFFWLQVICMKIFGVNEFAARLPNAICGVITLFLFYKIGKKLYDGLFGFLWALAYIGSFLPNLYFKSAIIDPVFNLFIFLGLYFLMQSIWSADHKKMRESIKNAVFAGLFTGLAVLTKGPVGFLLVFLSFVVFWINKQEFNKISKLSFVRVGNWQSVLTYALVVFFVSCFWFAADVFERGTGYFIEFINYQIRLFTTPDAGHEQPFFYHFVVVFVGCFPMSAFGLRAFYYKNVPENNDETTPDPSLARRGVMSPTLQGGVRGGFGNSFRVMMLCIFWVVMIIFSIAQTKIVHYSSMAYFPLSFLCAYALYHLLAENVFVSRWSVFFVAFLGSVFGLAVTILPIAFQYKEKFFYLIEDDFAVACLSQDVVWGGWEFLIGAFYLFCVWLGVYYFSKKMLQKAILTLFASTAIFLSILAVIIVPKIEAYFQRPMIEFYKNLAGKDVYAIPFQFKSYAQYFYQKYPKYDNPKAYDYKDKNNVEQWLLRGADVDKPAYFVIKVNDTLEMKKYEDTNVKKMYQGGGFVFYERQLQKK